MRKIFDAFDPSPEPLRPMGLAHRGVNSCKGAYLLLPTHIHSVGSSALLMDFECIVFNSRTG